LLVTFSAFFTQRKVHARFNSNSFHKSIISFLADLNSSIIFLLQSLFDCIPFSIFDVANLTSGEEDGYNNAN
jgi:hypothetical protein